MKVRKFLFILLAFTFKASKGFSWGSFGHQAIAIIAEDNLSENSKKKLKEVLDTETSTEASVWPDQIKNDSQWNHTRSYHFVNINDNENYLNFLKNQSNQQKTQGDILRALIESENVLRNVKRNRQAQTYALKFMIHFVGDLHQPLHAGRLQDLGGNNIKVNWFNQSSNLHSVWDTMILRTYIQSLFSFSQVSATNDLETYLQSLRKPQADEVADWQSSYLDDWFEESYKMRDLAYSGNANQNQIYFNKNINLVNDQILKAGYRLAGLLNSIFSNEGLSNQAKLVRRSIQQIIDPSKYKILLTPQRSVSQKVLFNNLFTIDINDPCLTHLHH